MNATYRLKRRSLYARVYKKGSWVSLGRLAVVYCVSKQDCVRIGFSVSKKFGKAVQRNRTKRQLKECVSKLLPRIKKGYDCIFVVKVGLTDDYAKLCTLVATLLANADLLTNDQV